MCFAPGFCSILSALVSLKLSFNAQSFPMNVLLLCKDALLCVMTPGCRMANSVLLAAWECGF